MSIAITWQDDSNAVVSCQFDVDEQETHDLQNVITEHPVETGSDISDNVRPQLRRFTVEGFVTDSPLIANPGVQQNSSYVSVELQIPPYPQKYSETALIRTGIGALTNAIFGAPGNPKATLLKLNQSTVLKSRKKAIFDALDDARVNARICNISTALFFYSNMLIEQITVTRAPDSGNGATFAVTLKEVTFVSSDVVDAPQPSEVSGAVAESSGSKNGIPADPKKAANTDSALKKMVDGGISYVKSVF